MDLAAVTSDDFRPWVGSRWVLSAASANANAGPGIQLVLDSVSAVADGARPFVLSFSGPPEPVVPQTIWRLSHPEAGEVELFLAPVGLSATSADYEVVFN